VLFLVRTKYLNRHRPWIQIACILYTIPFFSSSWNLCR